MRCGFHFTVHMWHHQTWKNPKTRMKKDIRTKISICTKLSSKCCHMFEKAALTVSTVISFMKLNKGNVCVEGIIARKHHESVLYRRIALNYISLGLWVTEG